jgi:hypothetical protein
MLAHVRSCFRLSFLVAFAVAACLSVQAQISGVPASVTSYGFGGSANPSPGVRVSVTSLAPNGYANRWPVFGNCCASFFLPANPNPPLFSGRRHRRDDRPFFPVGVSEPLYIPYAVPYVQETDNDSDDDYEYVRAPRQRNPDTATKRTAARDSAPKPDFSSQPTPAEPEEPVAAQLATVLVFKDGHQSDVLNYVIVGDTLFDFGVDRTHKILLADLDLPATRKVNDDHGVDFQIPASASQR